jgi:hypothetical protein
MKISLVCIAKMEDFYINEWVLYHKKLGFDDIIIYETDWINTQFDFCDVEDLHTLNFMYKN